MPNFEDVVYKLPLRVTFLGEVLEPVAKSLHQAMTRKVKPSGHEFLIVDDLLRHMGVIPGDGRTSVNHRCPVIRHGREQHNLKKNPFK